MCRKPALNWKVKFSSESKIGYEANNLTYNPSHRVVEVYVGAGPKPVLIKRVAVGRTSDNNSVGHCVCAVMIVIIMCLPCVALP